MRRLRRRRAPANGPGIVGRAGAGGAGWDGGESKGTGASLRAGCLSVFIEFLIFYMDLDNMRTPHAPASAAAVPCSHAGLPELQAAAPLPVTGVAADYPAGLEVEEHSHECCQLLDRKSVV